MGIKPFLPTGVKPVAIILPITMGMKPIDIENPFCKGYETILVDGCETRRCFAMIRSEWFKTIRNVTHKRPEFYIQGINGGYETFSDRWV